MLRPQVLTFLTVSCLAILPRHSHAVDKLEIDWRRDARYLPMQVDTVIVWHGQETRRPVVRPLQLFGLLSSDSLNGGLAQVTNPNPTEDLPAQIKFYHLLDQVTWQESPLWCTIGDFTTYFDTKANKYAVATTAFSNDSAFIIRTIPSAEGTVSTWVFIATGSDRTGNGRWDGDFVLSGQVDYDFDGRTELFFHLNSSRDLTPRLLICVEMEELQIEWVIDHPGFVSSDAVVSCGDSLDPRVVVVSDSRGQNVTLGRYSSNLGYLTCINARGEIVWDYVSGVFGASARIVRVPENNNLYVAHSHALTTTEQPSLDHIDNEPDFQLSALGADGRLLQKAALPEDIVSLWCQDYGVDGHTDVWLLSRTGVIRVFDTSLQMLAESEPTSLRLLIGILPPFDRGSSTLAFYTDASTEFFRDDLTKLASFPAGAASAQAALLGPEGHFRAVILTGPRLGFLGMVAERQFTDYIATAYLDYRTYFLVLFSSLVVGLVALNYQHSRVSSQKRQLEVAHKELQRIQQQLIEAEKYKQAKDIAGGFAHEIRNALFPAEASLLRMRRTFGGGIDQKQVERLAESSAKAVHRAISLTELISQYTRLDTSPDTEPTCVQAVVLEVLSANEERIRQQSVMVDTRGTDHARVAIAQLHLYTILNNLVLNGLDALNGRPDPHILIVWEQDDSKIRITCTDNGSGIAEADRQRIFDPFFSTKPNTGTGLGLAIVKKIVTLYGGTAEARSEPGQGTTFSVVLAEWEESNNRS